jgi:hypothetical protein
MPRPLLPFPHLADAAHQAPLQPTHPRASVEGAAGRKRRSLLSLHHITAAGNRRPECPRHIPAAGSRRPVATAVPHRLRRELTAGCHGPATSPPQEADGWTPRPRVSSPPSGSRASTPQPRSSSSPSSVQGMDATAGRCLVSLPGRPLGAHRPGALYATTGRRLVPLSGRQVLHFPRRRQEQLC